MADSHNFRMEEPDKTNNASMKPKGILKHTHEPPAKAEVKWDEMNILETYHPANKDYGHMKINEPPTPYSKMEGLSDEEEGDQGLVDPSLLSDKMLSANPRKDADESGGTESDEDESLTPEESEKKRNFRKKRSKHYDEFSKVKLARELIAKELSELEDDDDTPKGMEVTSEGS